MRGITIATLLLGLGACGGGLEGEMKDWKDKICKCTDEACVEKAYKDYSAWGNTKRDEYKKLADGNREKLNALDKELRACRKKLQGGAGGKSSEDKSTVTTNTQDKFASYPMTKYPLAVEIPNGGKMTESPNDVRVHVERGSGDCHVAIASAKGSYEDDVKHAESGVWGEFQGWQTKEEKRADGGWRLIWQLKGRDGEAGKGMHVRRVIAGVGYDCSTTFKSGGEGLCADMVCTSLKAKAP